MSQPRYPKGWDEARVRRVLEHYAGSSWEEVRDRIRRDKQRGR